MDCSFRMERGVFILAKAIAKENNQLKAVVGKEKINKSPHVIIIKRPRLKNWYNKKIKLWQAILMSIAAVWLFWIFWVVGYIGGQIR